MELEQKDLVNPELRLIEGQIDEYHKRNQLTTLPFAQAAWYYMAFCEDFLMIHGLKGHSDAFLDNVALTDEWIADLKSPLFWLYSCCAIGGRLSQSMDMGLYESAREMFSFSERYSPFEYAFTYASRGLFQISLQDGVIVPSDDLRLSIQLQAYDYLVRAGDTKDDFDFGPMFELVKPLLRVDGPRFTYKLNPRLMSTAMELLGPLLDRRYSLPDRWKFSRYSMADFKKVSQVLVTIGYIHLAVRLLAIQQGCEALGYLDSIFLASPSELSSRLVRYSGCEAQKVDALIEDMTYAGRGVERPDPAIQPLVMLNDETYALMPSLVTNSWMERNFIVLLNRIPAEKAIYASLVREKEVMMRDRIIGELCLPSLRFFHGKAVRYRRVGGVDLALISDAEKICIILELKWFVMPAEVREIMEKSEEIEKGVNQLLQLSDVISQDSTDFFRRLQIDQSYRLVYAVVSDNFIGMHKTKYPQVPVVQAAHLIRKANQFGGLQELSAWLENHDYLPVEGIHYEVVEEVWKIGEWALKWLGMRLLDKHDFE